MDKILAWIIVVGLAGFIIVGFPNEWQSNIYTELALLLWGISFLTLTIINHVSKGVMLDIIHAWERERPYRKWIARVYTFFPIITGLIILVKILLN